MAKDKALEYFTSQLREVTTLPTVSTICRMTAEDVKDKNQLISNVLTNFEQQLKRDYKAFERERHQNVLVAGLNYEQQIHIIDANKQHLELSNQREQLVQESVGLDIQLKVHTIKDSLKALQDEMVIQCRDLGTILGPINTTHLMETMKKMKEALQSVTYQNAYLQMHNSELILENSYMTPVQRSTIAKIKADNNRLYTQQRVIPHYIEAHPQGTIVFQPHEGNIVLPNAPFVNTEELLKEVDEILLNRGQKREHLVITPTATDSSMTNSTIDATEPTVFASTGKGKRPSHTPSLYHSQDRPDNAKKSRTDYSPTQGSSTVSNTTTGKGKSWHSLDSSSNFYWEPKGKGRGKGKGQNYAQGHRFNGNMAGIGSTTPSNVPSLNPESPIYFYTLEELEHPSGICPIKTVPYKLPTAPRFMYEPIRTRPPNIWLKARTGVAETLLTDVHAQTYIHALECMRRAINSPYERTFQDRDTGGWINCEGQFVKPDDLSRYIMPHKLPYELDKYGDLVRVLRYRPQLRYTQKPEVLEYVPNDKYTWKFVKHTMRSYCPDKVGTSRFWNDQYIRDPGTGIAPKVAYSLHDHCPGMPIDLEQECELLKLDPFVHNEIRYFPQLPADKHPPWDLEGTVTYMVDRGILNNSNQNTIIAYVADLAKIRKEYEDKQEDWPVEIGIYMLSLHVQRLRTIEKVLTSRLEQIANQAAEEQALAQNNGQNGVPNGNVQEEIRLDNEVAGGAAQ